MSEPDVTGMRTRAFVAPESLMTIQSEGRIFVPVENYDGIDARLVSDTLLGFIVMQEADLYSAKDVLFL